MAELEKSELEEKQRKIEAANYVKEMEEDMKKSQEEAKKEYDKRKVEKEESKKDEKVKTSSTTIYNFKIDKDCSDFSNASEATKFMNESKAAGFGDHRLDRNKDGIACN
ncbi:hypothetical protein BK130_03300 [Viridibacillus sp. FSL H8-0123]|nr:hypothetical protein BK130_03300 [Viridibacillus sp. FSL H8-0123]OMC86114.1 hypothetical protein BK128_13735 [Viridibacillus sp. FSL H7-0596]OMC92001.1 hypothetical protein BK137_07255 [Viridibacillus arenosi]